MVPCTVPITNTYTYDSANRLTSVNGQPYTWDNNGNLLNDGTNTYGYDAANRLSSVVNGQSSSSYTSTCTELDGTGATAWQLGGWKTGEDGISSKQGGACQRVIEALQPFQSAEAAHRQAWLLR
ncbi:MAG: hypothetical protein FJ030_19565 [Chloroflexi bacterium]|nr:hypothetical protein [Chloroflexota bacterium]